MERSKSPGSSITNWLEGLPDYLPQKCTNLHPDGQPQPGETESNKGGVRLKRKRKTLGEMSSNLQQLGGLSYSPPSTPSGILEPTKSNKKRRRGRSVVSDTDKTPKQSSLRGPLNVEAVSFADVDDANSATSQSNGLAILGCCPPISAWSPSKTKSFHYQLKLKHI
jgi:hypothetical protein